VCDLATPNAWQLCGAGLYPDGTKANWVPTWNDSKRAGSEGWDDGNITPGDGCSATCTIETGYVCTGGTPTTVDTCVENCGDTLRVGIEEWDDSNTTPGDGCSATCTIEAGYVCDAATPNAWQLCGAGFYPNGAKDTCVELCGDSKRVGIEGWDDGNSNNGDGCDSIWAIESNWVCSGGSSTAADTWTAWLPGETQNNPATPTSWVTTWGDSIQAGAEKCDDGNTADSDGWAGNCSTVETGYVCASASYTSVDVCTLWAAGYYQDSSTNPTVWVTRCGDQKEVGTEKCDDGNTADTDGWAADCSTVEAGWVWLGGSVSNKDTCNQWTAGLYQDNGTNPEYCVPLWGDGLEAGTEKWDDGNTANSDGCNSGCTSVEAGWVCVLGSTTARDRCTQCANGYEQDSPTSPEYCVTRWGDGFEAGTEKCDDGNTANTDGCNSGCTSVEAGWVCLGGSPTASDTCTQCTAGFYQDNTSNPEYCVPNWGDSLEAGIEKWDDGNTANGDGCNSGCTSVEAGWVCLGGSTSSIDVWALWAPGYYQDSPTNPEYWVSICGDGLEVGTELWDDGNTANSDGCKSDCTGVESGWVCKNGNSTHPDKWEQCTTGYIQDNSSNPENCIEKWGDGLRVGHEHCDDNNTINGDGCSSDWFTVEIGWACSGGSVNSTDEWANCPVGYIPRYDQRTCIVDNYSSGVKLAVYIYLAVTAVGMVFNAFSMKMFGHSSHSLLQPIYQLQMYLLLPLLATMGESTVDFLRSFKILLFSFVQVPTNIVFFSYDTAFDSFGYPQSNPYLYLLDLRSNSSMVNTYNYIWVVMVLAIWLGIIVGLFLYSFEYEPESRRTKFLKSAIKFTISKLCIRLFMISFVFILLACVSEIMEFERFVDGFVSYVYAMALGGLW
jgi:cysteine-rich repeat protein